jgi:hypothetical protein
MDSYANPDNDATVAATMIRWAKQEAAMKELEQKELVEIFSNDAMFLAYIKLFGPCVPTIWNEDLWINTTRRQCHRSGLPGMSVDERVNSVYIIQHANQGGAYLRIFYLDPVAKEVYMENSATDFWDSIDEFERVEFKEVDRFRWKMVRVSA